MRKTYRALAEEIKTDGERLRLIAALGNSENIAYHYHLICEEWAAGGPLSLENSLTDTERRALFFCWNS